MRHALGVALRFEFGQSALGVGRFAFLGLQLAFELLQILAPRTKLTIEQTKINKANETKTKTKKTSSTSSGSSSLSAAVVVD